MSEIKRYGQTWDPECGSLVVDEEPDGPFVLYSAHALELKERDERIERLEEVVEAAEELAEHCRRLTKTDTWADSNHVAIHADGMLDLEGLTRIFDAAMKKAEGK